MPARQIDHERIRSLLATKTDTEIAELVKCSKRTVARLRKETGHSRRHEPVDWAKYDHLLGTMNDHDLGALIGRTPAAIYQRRTQKGVAPYVETAERIDWNKYDSLLGTMSDAELARKIGCTPPSVRRRRVTLKITAYKRYTRHSWNIPPSK